MERRSSLEVSVKKRIYAESRDCKLAARVDFQLTEEPQYAAHDAALENGAVIGEGEMV